MRLIDCISREPITEKGVDIFQENFKIKEFYLEIDRRYIEQPKSFRKIKMREGVKKVIKDYLLECPKENILILISTADEKNPLSDLPEELRPCFPEIGWDELRKRIYWISSKEIEKMGE